MIIMSKNIIYQIYIKLLEIHGQQGWWPLVTESPRYHKGDYDFPKTADHSYEISIGAILTQNTSWPNVEMALENLHKRSPLTSSKIYRMSDDRLKELIRPSGYFNQKAKKIKLFTKFITKQKGVPKRDELLDVWGIGPETADSILLYAYNTPKFVVDAYTKRIFKNLGLLDGGESYNTIQELFESSLPRDLIIYQEYHALIVEHAKRFYSKKPYGTNCPLMEIIP